MNNNLDKNYHHWKIVDIFKVYMLSYIILITFFSILMFTFDLDYKNPNFILWNNITFPIILLFLVLHTIKQKHKLNIKHALNLYIPKNFNLWWCLALGIFIAIIAIFIPKIWTSTPPVLKNLTTKNIIVMYVLAGVFIAPVCEEIFWRGFAYSAIRVKFSRVYTIFFITLFAVIVHMPALWGAWSSILAISIASIVLTLLRDITNSTLPCIITHAAYNAGIATAVIISILFK